ncbi:MAG: hypothetical protein WC344_00800 [Bacilli bacterium]|jgi:hypothetical protein
MNIIILGSLFDGPHLGYIAISLALTALFLWLPFRFIKSQKYKDIYLKFWALATFFLHVSPLWVQFLSGQQPIAADNVLFPIYFCNMSMYLLVIIALWGNKKTKFFGYISTIVAYAGMFGALISLFYPEYYLHGASTIFEWGVFKSMLSHSTMLIGSIYLFVGGYFKVNRYNVIVYSIGLLFFGAVGLIVNWTFAAAGLYAPNAMYLQHPPIEDVPFLNVYVIAALMVLLVFAISYVYELINRKITLHKKPLVQINN